ncbi:MAG: hypothetical protein R6U89_05535 [Dehalococcoidia bacterium]
MWRMKHIAVILGVTIVTAIIGIALWTSEESQVLSDSPDATCEGWCLGPADAPIVLRSFPDFT